MLRSGTGTLAVALTLAVAGEGSPPAAPAPCFKSIIKPGGWEVPALTGTKETAPCAELGLPTGISCVRFHSLQIAWLPWYHVVNDRLMLDSFQFEFDALTRLEVQGRPFAVVGYAKGHGVGMSANIRWLDFDGDGTFEEIEWFPDLSAVPSWVADLATKRKGV